MDDVVLFKKNYPGGLELTAPAENPSVQNIVNGNVDDQVMFLGYDVAKKEMDGDKYLHIVSYWKRLGSLKNHLGIFFQFFDSQGQPVFAKGHSLGYRVYGPDSWPEGQIIRENQYIYIPSSIKNDVYEVRAGIYILENGFLLPVLGAAKIDAVGRMVLNDVTID